MGFDDICPDVESVKKRMQIYKLSLYATEYWGVHTRKAEESCDVQNTVVSFLKSENKKNSMLQMEEYTSRSNWFDGGSFTKGQTLLHVIAMNGVATVCKRVLAQGPNGNDSTASCCKEKAYKSG
jgi:hypothetical protein